ncbi:MAG: DUF1214 domain-containing protein [Deltaproteobacteria bacterium]|nr:DUF1214 domain-containing protein [Deltaproteobacteria bacterium]MBW2362187.1 DUF1214 domain-containing protein [Deltaproteobacteria bacterium]
MDRSRDPIEYLRSGAAWSDYCDGLKEAGADIFRELAPKSPIDLAEGHRYLARMVRFGLEHIMEGGDPRLPVFFPSLCEVQKSGWDNPDNHHTNAYINGAHDYRVSGRRGGSHTMSFAVYAGSLGREGGRRTVAYVKIDDLEVAPDGSFEIILSQRERPGNWIPLTDDATTLMVREIFWRKREQERAVLEIECLSEEPPPELTPDFVVNALRRSLRFMRGSSKIFFDTVDEWIPTPNVIHAGDREKASSTLGIPDQLYKSGWWKCQPDQAVVVEVTPPECRYWSFALCDYWGGSFDYRYWKVHVNKETALYRPDASVRIVVAHRDPGLVDANWLDTAGHDQGVWNLRWMEAREDRLPTVRVVEFAELAGL